MIRRKPTDTLESTIRSLLSAWGVSWQGASLLLGVSGGRDSMCLLHLVGQLFSDLGLSRVVVASVHHGLRGAEADADLALVQEEAVRWGFSFVPVYLHGASLLGKGGFEARARTARYEALEKIRQEQGLDWVCTAHHRDDQVETLLLRMLRGTGLLGLRGIHAARADRVLRPLLWISAQALSQYAQENGVRWREDPSNCELRYRRNFVRHALLPVLRTQNAETEHCLLRVSERARHILARIASEEAETVAPHAELFRLWKSLRGVVEPTPEPINRPNPLIRGPDTQLLGQEGELLWGSNMYLFTWQFRDRKDLAHPLPEQGEVAWIDSDRLPQSLCVRCRREGDRFSPPGLRSMHRKLKKFFQEQGISRELRDGIPLVAFEDEVLWIPGFAVSGRYQVREQTQTVLELRRINATRKSPEGLTS